MYYKNVCGRQISALGFGLLRLPALEGNPDSVDREQSQMLIDLAIQNGVNYFDTAYTYLNGESERAAGDILSAYPRESYNLASKFYVTRGLPIDEMFEEQLRRCKTEYFDFYLLHGVQEQYLSAYMSPEKDYIGYLKKQQKAGRIRHIGFSSHMGPEALEQFLDWYDGFDMALIQMNYVDWTMLQAKKQYEILTDHGIPVWVMEPMKGGRLSTLDKESASILKEAAPGQSVSSWGFRFLQDLPNVHTVLSGMSTLEQVQDNLKTFEYCNPLSQAEKAVLEKAKQVFLSHLGVPCSSCRYCCDTCPAGLDIPLLIREYNERNTSGETWRVGAFPDAKTADDCIKCGVCSSRCPQKIDIPAVMRELKGAN